MHLLCYDQNSSFQEKEKGAGDREYLQNISIIAFKKSGMVVCIRQFTPQTKVFGLQIPYPYNLILYTKVVTLTRVRWYLNLERLFGNAKFKTVVLIFWSSWTKSKHRILQ